MKITSQRIRGFLVILLVAQTINLGMFEGLKITSTQLGNFIYQSTSAQFLTPASIIHKGLATDATKNKLKK